MLAPNKNEVIRTERVSSYTIGNVRHIHERFIYIDRTEMKEILVPLWDDNVLDEMMHNHINTKSPLWRGCQ